MAVPDKSRYREIAEIRDNSGHTVSTPVLDLIARVVAEAAMAGDGYPDTKATRDRVRLNFSCVPSSRLRAAPKEGSFHSFPHRRGGR